MKKIQIFVCIVSFGLLANLQASFEYEIVPFDYQDERMKEQLCAMVRDDQDIQRMTHETEASMKECLSAPDLKHKINYFVCRGTDGCVTVYGYMAYVMSDAVYLVDDPVKGNSVLLNSNYADDYIILQTIETAVGCLDNFAVHKDYRGKGIAQAMLRYFEQDCRKNGMKSLMLGVEVENDKARRAYAQYGFQIHPVYFTQIMVKILD